MAVPGEAKPDASMDMKFPSLLWGFEFSSPGNNKTRPILTAAAGLNTSGAAGQAFWFRNVNDVLNRHPAFADSVPSGRICLAKQNAPPVPATPSPQW